MKDLAPTARAVEPPLPGLTPGDLYYVLFRHKWKILACTLCGLIGIPLLYFVRPPVYVSEATIMVRYISETRTTSRSSEDTQIRSPDVRGENIINSEIAILTSLDLVQAALETLDRTGGPESMTQQILKPFGGGTNAVRAAVIVRKNLQTQVPKNNNTLTISFRHPDPATTQIVLRQLVETYRKRHAEIHQGVGFLAEFYSRQAELLRASLSQTEEELNRVTTNANVISIAETKQACIQQISRIEEELFTAQAQLEEKRTSLNELRKLASARSSDGAAATNAPVIPAAQIERYRLVCAERGTQLKRQRDLRLTLTDEHPLLKPPREDLARLEVEKQKLEEEYPLLVDTVDTGPAQATARREGPDPMTEALAVATLESRVATLTNQLETVRVQAARVVQAEPNILQLQRQRDMEETKLRFYSSSLEQARLDENYGTGKITNISVVQNPTPAALDNSRLRKPLLALLAFSLLGGPALAFFIDRFLDQSIKRLVDLERFGRFPVFMSIPDTSIAGSKTGIPAGISGPPASAFGDGVPPWDPQHKLRAYYEGLRDRLVTHFEVRNMNHKPKLVAVTSCRDGAGVTTIAAGLAATLSETGDGNVLLVDMNLQEGAAHPFQHGKPACALSQALESSSRDPALVHENLYVVTAEETNNQKLPRVLPRRFANLVPKMKASDFDYIIFDMPPITQTSVTPRLSGFMDLVLMVVESEKTGLETLTRAHGLLTESRASVAAVLNKLRRYVPKGLSQEF